MKDKGDTPLCETPPLSVYCPELMSSRLVVACARCCVCFEFDFELNVKFTVNSWEDTSFVFVGSFLMVAQCLVVDSCTNTCRVAQLVVSHLISSHPSVARWDEHASMLVIHEQKCQELR